MHAPDLPAAGGAAGTDSLQSSNNAVSNHNNLSPGGMDLTLSPIAFDHPPPPPSGALLALQRENSEMKKQLHHAQEQLAAEGKCSNAIVFILPLRVVHLSMFRKRRYECI